jgi:hypothetical protein
MRASSVLSVAVVVFLVLALLSAGCGQKPTGAKNTSFQPFWDTTPPTQGGTPVPTTPDVGAVVEATPFPVATVTSTPTLRSRGPPEYSGPNVNYTFIYDKEIPFKYNTTAVIYDLKNPPLIIDFTMKTVNISRVTVARDPTCTPTETDLCLKTVTVTYPDPAAWFTITVRDLGTNQIVAQSGYARDYDVGMDKQLTIRVPGNYHIEMSGTRLSAVVRMKVVA